jgi:phage major tail protein, phi13 family
MSDNIVTFGLKNVYYSLINNIDGNINYLKSKKISYAQEISADLTGETTSIYADDKMYATFNIVAGYTINLKVTELSNEFKIDVLGYKVDQNNNLVETNRSVSVPFALGYEISGDANKRRIWHLFCYTNPISFSTKSKTDSVEANSITLAINTYSLILKNYEVSRIICNEKDLNYDTFLILPPKLTITTSKVYIFDLSSDVNDSFIDVVGNVSSINGYTYNGKTKSKGLKLNSSQYLIIHTNAEAKEVYIKLAGYCNSSTVTTRVLIEDLDELTNSYSEQELSNKNIKEISAISFKALAGHTYKIRKGDAEAMIVLIEKKEVFEE